jgi:chlorite dismutase
MTDVRRQFVAFTFYRAEPEWRRVPPSERAAHRREFAEVITRWNTAGSMRVVPYSTVGTRAEAQMMLWRICYSLDELQRMSADLLGARLGGVFANCAQLHRHDQAFALHDPPRGKPPG